MQDLPQRAIGRQDEHQARRRRLDGLCLRALSARKTLAAFALLLWATTAHGQPTVVEFDEGGKIREYDERWRTVAAAGGPVKVQGMCFSACTMVVIYVPKPRLCFGDYSSLGFHQARYDDGTLAPTSTKWMIDRYPADIQAWIAARGGWQQMPVPGKGHWILPAKTLWTMGYRKCSD